MTELESSFHDDMLNIYIEAKKLKYTATYFYRMVVEHGGLQAAKILIHKDEVTSGFTRLWELKRLDLSTEALVLEDKYHDLFTDKERQICNARLLTYEFDITMSKN